MEQQQHQEEEEREQGDGLQMPVLVVIDASHVAQMLSFPLLLNHLRTAFSVGTAFYAPHRHHHSIQQGCNGVSPATLLLMPAWSQLPTCPYLGVKIVTVFPGNSQRSLPAVAASYVLSSSRTGLPLAFIDGKEVTLWRTACVSALAADYLARDDVKVMVMVGAGAMAPYLIKAHISTRPSLEKILIWNRTPGRAKALLESLQTELQMQVLETCSDLETAVRIGDLISCATLSEVPLVRGLWLKPGSHLDLVGSFTVKMMECDDVALARGRIYIDTEAALEESGELVGAINRGVIDSQKIIGTLSQLTTKAKKGREDADDITVFKTVGCAMVDLATAQLTYEKFRALQSSS